MKKRNDKFNVNWFAILFNLSWISIALVITYFFAGDIYVDEANKSVSGLIIFVWTVLSGLLGAVFKFNELGWIWIASPIVLGVFLLISKQEKISSLLDTVEMLLNRNDALIASLRQYEDIPDPPLELENGIAMYKIFREKSRWYN
jgi:hypothetical protein